MIGDFSDALPQSASTSRPKLPHYSIEATPDSEKYLSDSFTNGPPNSQRKDSGSIPDFVPKGMELLEMVQKNIIGDCKEITTPFGARPLIYCDWVGPRVSS